MNLNPKLLRYAGVAAAVTAAAALAHVGTAEASAYRTPAAYVIDGTLRIGGTAADDTIAVTFTTDGTQAVVDLGEGTTRTFARERFSAVTVVLGSGDDRFDASSGGLVADPVLTVHGNSGDDDIRGGRGADVLYGGHGSDVLDGGIGADTEFLGSGDDLALWVPGEGSDVVHGGRGEDTLDFVGAAAPETFTLDATGHRALLSRVQGSIRMDLDSIESVALSPLTGADQVVVNGTDASEAVAVRARSTEVNLTGLLPRLRILGAEPTDLLQINTRGGRDRVEVHRGVSSVITTSVDLGLGQ